MRPHLIIGLGLLCTACGASDVAVPTESETGTTIEAGTETGMETETEIQEQAANEGWTEFLQRSENELRKMLTAEQFHVTQEEGTEPPFENAYWDEKRPGIYVDVVSGEPLFSSIEKYDSGTGWPSFTRPLEPENIVTRTDLRLIVPRTEVRSRTGDSHLGHLFNDGPQPTGLRYCINSAALRFVPAQELEAEGYGEYVKLFALPSPPTPSSAGGGGLMNL